MSDFGKYWDDIKKHEKRVKYWLPHLKEIAVRVKGVRNLRYFTLCALTMIDVFMLVKEGVLTCDADSFAIQGIEFCECEPEHFTAIRDLVARENAGFLGRLEEIVLFEDDEFTLQHPTEQSIEEALELEDVAADERGTRLRLKQRHTNFRAAFPFDYVNLDFCEQYYMPPDMMKINKTVEKFLQWQRNPSADIDDFVMAVTCRLDEKLPDAAARRLANLVKANCAESTVYNTRVRVTRGLAELDEWMARDREDFFLSAWPKDIASIAKEQRWKTDIIDYVYYARTGDRGNPYIMVCLVARFSRQNAVSNYLAAALDALDKSKRTAILDRDPKSTGELCFGEV